ncbi:hypothetical protein OIO90_004242 [Microbotryomycetes sp. JL221]|nr:hypothetical protein OIO90_004242 [Microbotryomycetes sp. JL221]
MQVVLSLPINEPQSAPQMALGFTETDPTTNLDAQSSNKVKGDIFDALGLAFGRTADPSSASVPAAQQSTPQKSVRLTSANFYSALVAIGASYTDNAHPRDQKYKDSLRQYWPFDKYGGRYTNGPVAVEHMVDQATLPKLKQSKAGVSLIDYAYGGSVVSNNLAGTWAKAPAADEQVKSYLSDVTNSKIKLGTGRVLHYFNSGINPVAQIWTNALNQRMSYQAVYNAKRNVTTNVQSMMDTISKLTKDQTLTSQVNGLDVLIAGIPPLETVPTYQWQLPKNMTQVDRKKALQVLKDLTASYNLALETFATQLKGKTTGRVFFYDMAKLWRSMAASPAKYGLTETFNACYDSSKGKVCSKPDQYLYFDTLHPTTQVMKLMAQEMNSIVLGV